MIEKILRFFGWKSKQGVTQMHRFHEENRKKIEKYLHVNKTKLSSYSGHSDGSYTYQTEKRNIQEYL
jgi:adenine C2-methylase RlmN of 23S rRNA A2503 and tRNA A37